MNYFFGKQSKSYWLQSLLWLIAVIIGLGIIAYPLLDIQRNTQPLPQKPVVAPQTTGEAQNRPSVAQFDDFPIEPTVDTYMAVRQPHCTYSVYRTGGEGLKVDWAIGDGGFTAPWTAIKQTWSCKEK